MGDGADAGSSAGTADTPGDASQDSSTVYNGSVPCASCGSLLSPVAAMYAPDRHCHRCKKKKHHRHIKSRMSGR